MAREVGVGARRWWVAVLVAAVALTPGAPARADIWRVKIRHHHFEPASIQVKVGDTVRWANHDDTNHTVSADDDSFDSGNLGADESFSHTFDAAGTFRYHCNRHPDMTGEVQVGSTTTTTAAPTTTTTTAAPTTTTTTATATVPSTAPATTPTTAAETTTTATETTTPTAPPATTSATSAASAVTTAPTTTTTTAPVAGPAVRLGPEVPAVGSPEPAGPRPGTAAERGRDASSDRPRPARGSSAVVALLVAAMVGVASGGGWLVWRLRPGRG